MAAATNGNDGKADGPSNLITVASPEHFTSLMSADLSRVSLLNFWASWAEPCEQMNAVVAELAEKYPQILCLMVGRSAQHSSLAKEV